MKIVKYFNYQIRQVLFIMGIFMILFAAGIRICNGQKSCTASISTCPAEGCGSSRFDKKLNILKNRTTKPSIVKQMSLSDIVSLKNLEPDHWIVNSSRGKLNLWEKQAVVITGYLLRVRKSGPSTANCQLTGTLNVDWILSLSAQPDETREQTVLAEITPRMRQEEWTLDKLKSLESKKAFLRITGWLLLDTANLNNNTRLFQATNWEIHPIIEIEVCTKSANICLDSQMKKSNKAWIKLREYVGN